MCTTCTRLREVVRHLQSKLRAAHWTHSSRWTAHYPTLSQIFLLNCNGDKGRKAKWTRYQRDRPMYFMHGEIVFAFRNYEASSLKLYRYLHLKIILYRPIFTQLCRKTFPRSLPGSVRKSATEYKYQDREDNPLYSSFSQQCSITCVQAAQELIDLISITSQTDATGAWWYNIFCTFHRHQC